MKFCSLDFGGMVTTRHNRRTREVSNVQQKLAVLQKLLLVYVNSLVEGGLVYVNCLVEGGEGEKRF